MIREWTANEGGSKDQRTAGGPGRIEQAGGQEGRQLVVTCVQLQLLLSRHPQCWPGAGVSLMQNSKNSGMSRRIHGPGVDLEFKDELAMGKCVVYCIKRSTGKALDWSLGPEAKPLVFPPSTVLAFGWATTFSSRSKIEQLTVYYPARCQVARGAQHAGRESDCEVLSIECRKGIVQNAKSPSDEPINQCTHSR